MALNGVVLLSSIMNYGRRQPGLDRDYINYLPSYATTAWYLHKMSNPPATVEQAAAEARAFAEGPYASALEKGQTISPQERDSVAQQMAGLTGLSPDFIERANLRVDLSRFRKELLRGDRETIEVPYGTFIYAVTRHRIVKSTDLSVLRSPRHELV